jgi:phosphate transport system ATP-binding protein
MPESPSSSKPAPVVQVRDMDFCYGSKAALHGINLLVEYHRVTALIGPSGCGKSTLLRCINRMNDRVVGARVSKGEILVKGKNIHDADVDLTQLRKQVGMVFQKSNPFPKTIYENVAYGLRVHGVKDKIAIDEAVQRALTQAALWDELKDRLHDHALGLSGGQQQRLCIARAIATMPDVLLMDEPCSALDPIATLKIEELITQLARDYTVVIVTHNMQQAVRVSDFTAFLHLGKLVEFAPTEELFTNPREKLTDSYLRGTFS